MQRLITDYFGYSLDSVTNVTDIDDKILVRAKELSTSPRDLAAHWERDFHDDMHRLNVR